MTIHQELSKLRKEEVSPQLSKTHTQKYTDWHRQARTEGFNWQKLEALALSEEPSSPRKQEIIFKVGTKLLREYQGLRYQVLVTSEGFLYDGVPYRSLTAIANKITGKKWNGKVFFKVHLSSRTSPRGNPTPLCNGAVPKVACAERCLHHPVSEAAEYGK